MKEQEDAKGLKRKAGSPRGIDLTRRGAGGDERRTGYELAST